jgi:predicted 3-demethylubiquinone-9 3-methyltransferase (glyoxalase superfamily)
MTTPIIPCLWFDNRGEEAVKLYTSLFRDGKVGTVARYPEGGMMPEDSVMTVKFSIAGQEIIALNGGPYFKFTPATSLFAGCESVAEFDRLWDQLAVDGSILMEPEQLPPFFEKFGWLQDRYGLSWQFGVCGIPQYITPFLLFVGKHYGQAEEAINFYRSVFDTSSLDSIVYYGKDQHDTEGMVQHASFSLNGLNFMASESGWDHQFDFTEAFSFCVYCATQAEIDHYWDTLSEGGEQSRCGWLKDRYGVWWQIVPYNLEKLMTGGDAYQAKRVNEALMQMTKPDMDILQKACTIDHC